MTIRSVLADIFNFFFRPKRYAASANLYVRDIYHSLFKTLFSSEVKRRDRLDQQNTEAPLFQLPEKEGYLKINGLDPELRAEVISAAKTVIEKTLTPDYIKKFEGAPFVSIPIKDELGKNNPFLKFALQKSLLKSLTKYFGILPVIENINIWYSPNKNNLSGSSQFYHLDGQDVKTIQLFLFIEEVHLENGPLVIVEAEKSVEIAKEIGYRKTKILKRVDDDLIRSKTTPDQIINAVGTAGDCYVVDTDRCFHYGSRKASKPRYLIVFQYYTPFAFVLPFKWWKKLPYANLNQLTEFSDFEKAVLGAKP